MKCSQRLLVLFKQWHSYIFKCGWSVKIHLGGNVCCVFSGPKIASNTILLCALINLWLFGIVEWRTPNNACVSFSVCHVSFWKWPLLARGCSKQEMCSVSTAGWLALAVCMPWCSAELASSWESMFLSLMSVSKVDPTIPKWVTNLKTLFLIWGEERENTESSSPYGHKIQPNMHSHHSSIWLLLDRNIQLRV